MSEIYNGHHVTRGHYTVTSFHSSRDWGNEKMKKGQILRKTGMVWAGLSEEESIAPWKLSVFIIYSGARGRVTALI